MAGMMGRQDFPTLPKAPAAGTPQSRGWTPGAAQDAAGSFGASEDYGDFAGWDKVSDGSTGFNYSKQGAGSPAPSAPSSGQGGGSAFDSSASVASLMSGAGGGVAGAGGAKVAMPDPVSSPSMDALQSGIGGSPDMGGGTESMGAPSQFRQGIGKRIYPQESAALASLRKVY